MARRLLLALALTLSLSAGPQMARLTPGVAFDTLRFDGTASGTPETLTARGALDLADEPQQPGYDELVARLRWTY